MKEMKAIFMRLSPIQKIQVVLAILLMIFAFLAVISNSEAISEAAAIPLKIFAAFILFMAPTLAVVAYIKKMSVPQLILQTITFRKK